jgi:protein-S-isoprenylcysteine O-methyltransferase Ste14
MPPLPSSSTPPRPPRLDRAAWNVPALVVGIAFLIAGSLLRRHCWKPLGEHFTGDVQAEAYQPVITRGAYRWVRHPADTGGILMFAGIGVALASWGSFAILVVAAIVVYGYRVRVEERALVQTIGEPYVAYVKTHKPFVPSWSGECGRLARSIRASRARMPPRCGEREPVSGQDARIRRAKDTRTPLGESHHASLSRHWRQTSWVIGSATTVEKTRVPRAARRARTATSTVTHAPGVTSIARCADTRSGRVRRERRRRQAH